MCSSLVGRAELTLPLWEMLEMDWGPAREVRADQPLLALAGKPHCRPDPLVRQVRMHELEQYLPAAVAMFIEEVGVDPRANDGGRGYRRRVANLIAAGRAWARFEDEQVIFKAEVGSVSSRVGQIQGVWVHPMYRGQGFGAAGTATVAEAVIADGRTASLYVNSFNTVARSAYARIGFSQVATFATILLD
jgi:predicted GNAT family acetyltransferase